MKKETLLFVIPAVLALLLVSAYAKAGDVETYAALKTQIYSMPVKIVCQEATSTRVSYGSYHLEMGLNPAQKTAVLAYWSSIYPNANSPLPEFKLHVAHGSTAPLHFEFKKADSWLIVSYGVFNSVPAQAFREFQWVGQNTTAGNAFKLKQFMIDGKPVINLYPGLAFCQVL